VNVVHLEETHNEKKLVNNNSGQQRKIKEENHVFSVKDNYFVEENVMFLTET